MAASEPLGVRPSRSSPRSHPQHRRRGRPARARRDEMGPAARLRRAVEPVAESLEDRQLLTTTFTVMTDADTGAGSVRQAIIDANKTANVGGPDVIQFKLPGIGGHKIQLASALPDITDPVVIDGYSQPGAMANTNGPTQGNNAWPMVELSGNHAVVGDGLAITAGGSTVRGLAIDGFLSQTVGGVTTGGNGIRISGGAGGNVVAGNFIGLTPTGGTNLNNAGNGVQITASSNDRIGGTPPPTRT